MKFKIEFSEKIEKQLIRLIKEFELCLKNGRTSRIPESFERIAPLNEQNLKIEQK